MENTNSVRREDFQTLSGSLSVQELAGHLFLTTSCTLAPVEAPGRLDTWLLSRMAGGVDAVKEGALKRWPRVWRSRRRRPNWSLAKKRLIFYTSQEPIC